MSVRKMSEVRKPQRDPFDAGGQVTRTVSNQHSSHDTICARCKGTGRIDVVGFEDRKPRGTATCMSCLGHGSIEELRDALLAARKAAA